MTPSQRQSLFPHPKIPLRNDLPASAKIPGHYDDAVKASKFIPSPEVSRKNRYFHPRRNTSKRNCPAKVAKIQILTSVNEKTSEPGFSLQPASDIIYYGFHEICSVAGTNSIPLSAKADAETIWNRLPGATKMSRTCVTSRRTPVRDSGTGRQRIQCRRWRGNCSKNRKACS